MNQITPETNFRIYGAMDQLTANGIVIFRGPAPGIVEQLRGEHARPIEDSHFNIDPEVPFLQVQFCDETHYGTLTIDVHPEVPARFTDPTSISQHLSTDGRVPFGRTAVGVLCEEEGRALLRDMQGLLNRQAC